jgi:FkbH-like protein
LHHQWITRKNCNDGRIGCQVNAKSLITQLEADAGWRSLRAVQRALRGGMSRPDSLALARFLAGEKVRNRMDFAARSVRVSVASDSSLDNLADPLALRLLERGMFGIQYHSPFAQLALETRNPDSGLSQHKPEVVVLAPLTGIWQKLVGTSPDAVTQAMEAAWSQVAALRENFAGLILLANAVPVENRPHGILESRRNLGRADFARAVNLQLSQRCRETGDAFVLDAQWLAGQAGTVWPGLHKQQLMASRPFTDSLADLLAAEIAAFCAARKGFARKCLVLDLDNTLWGGVVGEDGVAGLQIGGGFPGNIYTELQKEIAVLHERGVTLAIVSKNNEADAWEVFNQRPEMVLKRADFSAHRINWQDKASNLQELAAELNLGLDAFVALDDNPVERDWIEEALPEIEVCPASDPLEMLRWLTTCRRFDTLAITHEDALRAKSYAAAEERSRLATQSSNLEEYLTSLETKVEIGCNSVNQVARVAQLTQKTNQFNLTTKRYTESEIQERMHNSAWRVFWCACRDRFADEGVIGAALIEIKSNEWLIDTFLMSCRVLGRGVEKAFVAIICQQAHRAGAKVIHGEFIRSAKNAQTENFFESCGFALDERNADFSKWHLNLPAANGLIPKWIALQPPKLET